MVTWTRCETGGEPVLRRCVSLSFLTGAFQKRRRRIAGEPAGGQQDTHSGAKTFERIVPEARTIFRVQAIDFAFDGGIDPGIVAGQQGRVPAFELLLPNDVARLPIQGQDKTPNSDEKKIPSFQMASAV